MRPKRNWAWKTPVRGGHLSSGRSCGVKVHRRELFRQGWKDVGKVFLLAAIVDVIYQLIVHRGVYKLEVLITAVTLAIVPYVLVRGPISRVAKMMFAVRAVMKHPPDPVSDWGPGVFGAARFSWAPTATRRRAIHTGRGKHWSRPARRCVFS